MKTKPALRLRELITSKYGPKRFSLACDIIAQWLSVPLSERQFSGAAIISLCKTGKVDEPIITQGELELLRKLFGLKDYNELFY